MALDINSLNAGHAKSLKSHEVTKADTANPSSRSQAQNAAAQQTAVPKDSVSLTQQAQTLSQMQRAMASSPSFNQERVASIKKAISDGQYKVNPEKLAQKMHQFEEELGKLVS